MLGIAPRRIQRWQAVGLLLGRHLRLFDPPCQFFEQVAGFFDLLLVLLGLDLPLAVLGAEGGELVLQPAARLDDEPDLRFQAADLGIGLVQLALRLVQAVADAEMGLAQVLQFELDVAQPGGLFLEVGLALRHVARVPGLLGLRFVLAQQPEQLLLFFLVGLQGMEAVRHHSLCVEFLNVGVQFAQDVVDAQQILARVAQPVRGFAAALLVLRDAGRLLEEHAQLFRARLDDARDHALADDGVGARTQARAEKNVLDVAPAHRLAVDVIGRGAVAREGALDGDLGVLAPLTGRLAVVVVEHQFDRGAPGRLPVGRAIEDDVLHRFAAQFRRFRLAQHPSYGVDDVRLAATIGTDHADQLTRHLEIGGIDERLKSRQFDGRETHVA